MIMKKNPLLIAALVSTILTGHSSALVPVNENFNTNNLDPMVWYQYQTGKGRLVADKKKLSFEVLSKPTNDDFASIELLTSQPGYNESWELILDLSNTSGLGFNAGCGIMLFNVKDRSDYMFMEFYGKEGGVSAGVITNGEHVKKSSASVNPRVSKGSIRIRFDKNSKLLTLHVSPTDADEGYTWIKLGTFSPTGKGGDVNSNWRMKSGSGRFGVHLFGFAQNTKVPTGKATLDNLIISPRP